MAMNKNLMESVIMRSKQNIKKAIKGQYSRSVFIIATLLCSLLIVPNLSFAINHSVILKVTNPNQRPSATPVHDSDGAVWTQVYVEIPAKLYMDKGWLDDDLKNLRFLDIDSGNIELAHWVPPKADNNLHINNLGVWLLVKDLQPGETEKIRMEMIEGGALLANPRAPANKRTYNRTDYLAAIAVFPFYAYNSQDWKWDKSGYAFSANVTFLNNAFNSEDDINGDFKSGNAAITNNEFTITIFNLKFYSRSDDFWILYFLSQATNLSELETSEGYRLYFTDYTSKSDDLHYSRYQFTIKLQQYIAGQWITKAETRWQPYNNSRYIFDLKVSKDKIFILINGRQHNFIGVNGGLVQDGKYIRTDLYQTGKIGYNRGLWKRCCNTDINYFFLRRYLEKEPLYEVYGNTDLLLTDTDQSTTIGEDINEIVPDLQQFSSTVNGNSLDDYIFATYSIARPEQIVDHYKITLRNRNTTNSETFNWTISNNNPSKWIVYFCDNQGENCHRNGPQNNTTSLLPNGRKTYVLKFIPTPSALVNGSSAEINIGVVAQGDNSFDNVKIQTRTLGNLGCFWKYRAKELITWPGGHGYSDLLDYQVHLKIQGEPTLQYAQQNGSDIIITDQNNSILDYWIKNFDRNSGTLEAWVKVPRIKGDGTETSIYVWWGNKNFATSRSNKQQTFDLWEDWENDYALGQRAGCDDGTTNSNVSGVNVPNSTLIGASCENQPIDPHGWENVPTPDDWYNWWEIDEIGGSQIMQADISPTHKSGDKGPFIHHGGLGWDHYEITYQIYTGTYHQYSRVLRWGNPQYNPVFFNDAGNMWGMEYFADKFIFRPYGAGIDFVWQYQTRAKNLIGSSFPKRNAWYLAKVRIYRDRNSGSSHLKLFMSTPKNNPDDLPDPDSSNGFVQIADFEAPPAFTLQYGGVGFGGWDSGFGFDNIRVRKYIEDSSGNEPLVNNSSITENDLRDDLTLSNPQITAPIFGGRPVYIETTAIPFAWRGDILAFYADCYINGDCQYSNCTVCGGNETCPNITADQCEFSNKLGTISPFGKIDDETPKGVGYYLLKRNPGKYNPNPTSLLTSESRTLLTTDGNSTLINFDLSECDQLKNYLGTSGTCDANDNFLDETEKLILFVRGYYIDGEDFARSASRNFDATPNYGNNDGIPDPDEQWKIADVLHSNPLLIGIPNMVYGYPDYWEFVEQNDKRPLVSYFMSNQGILHAVRLATVDANGTYEVDENARELWAFIPHAVLSKLKSSTDADHEYLADGLLRAIDIKVCHRWRTILFGIGGRDNIYVFAMDITDPYNPVLLWEHNGDPTGKIGTTISSPAFGLVDTNNNGIPDTWVAVVGSGYDQNYLNNYENKTAWLTLFNLKNGQILKQLKVSDKVGNVLTSITALRDPQTGVLKKIYFGDYYGALWRVSGERLARTDTFAPLEDNATLSTTYDMLYEPDDYGNSTSPTDPACPITAYPRLAKGEGLNEFWIFFGTGDYNEYDPTYPHQYFFGLKDKDINTGPYHLTDLQNVTDGNSTNTLAKSWYIKLGINDSADLINDPNNLSISTKNSNERVLKTPEVYGGLVFFTTYEPLDEPCGGGKSRFYALQYRTGLLKSGLFMDFTNNNQTVRSVELQSRGIPSQPMIFEGQNGKGTAVATGITTSTSGGIEKIRLNPAAFSTALDILLWREKH